MVALGHELRHAVEIADAPSIVDAHTLSAHYAVIGTCMNYDPDRETFETRAAGAAAAQARLELTGRAVRTDDQVGR